MEFNDEHLALAILSLVQKMQIGGGLQDLVFSCLG
jgi:hypothetical protein